MNHAHVKVKDSDDENDEHLSIYNAIGVYFLEYLHQISLLWPLCLWHDVTLVMRNVEDWSTRSSRQV